MDKKFTVEKIEERLWVLANTTTGRDVLGLVLACQDLLRRLAGREGGRRREKAQ